MPPEARWHAADNRQAWLQLAREHCWQLVAPPEWMTGLPELDRGLSVVFHHVGYALQWWLCDHQSPPVFGMPLMSATTAS